MAVVGIFAIILVVWCYFFSRTREMTVSTQEAEEKRKQLLAKELAIKRNLSLV